MFMQHKLVVRYKDGSIVKGITSDFFPNKDFFHVKENETGEMLEIDVYDLKAVYFVKSFEGNREYKKIYDVERAGFGKKIQVKFQDGETIVGYTQGFSPNRVGFFVFPADPDSNNDRIFVIRAATTAISFL